MILIFDTETNGLPQSMDAPIERLSNWPRILQIAWAEYSEKGIITSSNNFYIKPDGFIVSSDSERINGITNEILNDKGIEIHYVLNKFIHSVTAASTLVAHNVEFDVKIISSELHRINLSNPFKNKNLICTMKSTVDYCKIPGQRSYKYPKLNELYQKVFGEEASDLHNALNDVRATSKCFWKLVDEDIIQISKSPTREWHESSDENDIQNEKNYEVQWWNDIDEKTKSLFSSHYKLCKEGKCLDYEGKIQTFDYVLESFGYNRGSLLKSDELIDLSKNQLDRITYLSLSYQHDNIIFKYLKDFNNLISLEIGSTKDINISDISKIKNLKELSFNECNIVKTEPTNDLKNVSKLCIAKLSCLNFENDEFYTLFPNVTDLLIFDGGMSYFLKDWNPAQLNFDDFSILKLLQSLPNLKKVIIRRSIDFDLTELSDSNREIEYVECYYLSDSTNPISILKRFENLKILKTHLNQIFQELNIPFDLKLEELYLTSNLDYQSKQDLSEFSKLKNLKKLSLYSFVNIDNYKFLQDLVTLDYLNLKSCNLREIGCLKTLSNLKYLNLSYTRIDEIDLTLFPNLQELYLISTRIKSLHGITNLHDLEILHISNDNFQDKSGVSFEFWEPGESLNSLKELSIGISSCVFNTDLLEFMPNLETFNWDNCTESKWEIEALERKYPNVDFFVTGRFYEG